MKDFQSSHQIIGHDRRLRVLRVGCRPGAIQRDAKVTALNDQHAYLRIPPDADVRVGDLIGCGISHPCTTFDKWRVMFTIDDDYRVTGAVRTYF